MARLYRKNFAAYLEMSPEDMGIIEKMIAAVQNMLNVSRWDAISQMFLWGCEVSAGKMKDESVREQGRRVLMARQLADALDRERFHDKRIYAAVRALGYDEALRIAQEEGLDMEIVRELISRSMPQPDEMTFADKVSMWLSTVLGDGQPRGVDDIKRMACEDGLLDVDDEDSFRKNWQSMRKVANAMGLSRGGERGMWQRDLSKRQLDD